MQQQQKQLGSTYSTGANFSTTVVGNSATKSPNSSVDRKVINTLQIQPIDSRFCDTVKNCTFHSSLVQSMSKTEKMNPTGRVGWTKYASARFATPFWGIYKPPRCIFITYCVVFTRKDFSYKKSSHSLNSFILKPLSFSIIEWFQS